MEQTKLQWLFVAVEKSELHPNGVSVHCRRYSDPTLNFDPIEEDRIAMVL